MSRQDIATSLSVEYGRTIREEDVEAADEWYEEQAEAGAEAGGEAGGNTADSLKIDGAKTGSTKPAALSPPPSSLPGTSTPPTAQPTTPTPAVSQPPLSSVPAASGVVGGESPPTSEGPPPTTQPTAQPTAQPTTPLAVPLGVQRAPIAAIDRFIRDGYVGQDALEEIMKFNFKGKAYRKEVSQRRALFEARHPPFNDIPADFGGGVVGGGGGGGVVGGVGGETSENTRVLGPSQPTTQPTMQPTTPPTTQPTTQPTTFPDTFTAARNEPDAEALQSAKSSLRSLGSNLGAIALSADFARSIRVEDLESAWYGKEGLHVAYSALLN